MHAELKSVFDRYFEIVHADTESLRQEVYRLRYQVYVLEAGFERPEDFPDGLERDAFDARADHYLLRHRATGLYAATARMILPDPDDPMRPYPIELHCRIDADKKVARPEQRLRLGEVSRFAVSKAFKRRLGEGGSTGGLAEQVDRYLQPDERRILPHLSIGLLAAAVRSMHMHGLTYCYAAMEMALFRLVTHLGLAFHPIGPTVEYHGPRLPCLTHANESLPNIKRIAPPLWALMTDDGRYACGTE
ncbi:MAG: PEP-CTERM/exosortase system-associated acyltransferase [Thiobacillaceae bacterium]|nr:PEP-CTERM/exosortase system-associated acyltransferase [Thiobacillaceae bacterium]